MDEMNRRTALGLGIAAAAATPLLTLGSSPAAAQDATASTVDYGGKIIDFRLRPPIIPYRALFDLHISLAKDRKNQLGAAFPGIALSPSMYHVGEDEGLTLLLNEMDAAGITYGVAPGRQISGIELGFLGEGEAKFNVFDEDLVELRKRFNNRLFGLHALDLKQPMDVIVAGIDTAITKHGLSGVVMEPGYEKADDGSQLWADDKKLFPIYEKIIELDTFLMHQSGVFAGPDIGVNSWAPVDRLLLEFPKLKFLLAHGGYPGVFEALSLAVKHENFYISPDVYCFFPGGEVYVNSISTIPDQFVFATAYPMAAQLESVVGALKFPLTPEVMEKLMYGNAARLLKITS